MKNLIFEFATIENREDFINWIKPHLNKYKEENDPLDVNMLNFIIPKYSDENYLGDEIIIKAEE